MNRDTQHPDTLDHLIAAAQSKRISRRAALKRAAALGLSAPAVAALLAACGGSSESTATSSGGASTSTTGGATPSGEGSPTTGGTPSETATGTSTGQRGGGGTLNILWWQAPTILNAHLSLATKDVGAVRISGEPLADFGPDNALVPFLAAEIPSLDNGGVAKDGTSVTWKLRQGVKWHDGQPFTAADVVFTYEYLSTAETAATTIGYYQDVDSVEAVDDHTVKITFTHPTAPWFNPFVGTSGIILPKHILQDFVGVKAKDAPFNLKPIGTGPFKVTDFKPGDTVVFEINTDYYEDGKPFFDRVVMKGGGDAVSAARAVVQTQEADWAWNLQVEAQVLKAMESSGGSGKIVTWTGGGTEKLVINHSDPNTEQNGQKSYYEVPHPHLKELKVRQALTYAIQRDVIADTLYGPAGKPTGYTLNNNPQYMPKGITWEYNLDKAKQLLDEVGAAPGGDGIRVLNGRKMSWLYSSSANSVRQKTQEIIKASLKQLGIDVEIKAVESSVYFNALNPESFQHLYADFGMESNSAGVFPLLWYLRYLSANPAKDIAQKDNNWGGRNIQRYVNPQFNDLWKQASEQVDEAAYTETFLKMQEMVVTDIADVGLVARNNVAAVANSLAGYQPTPWTVDVWDIKNWTRTK